MQILRFAGFPDLWASFGAKEPRFRAHAVLGLTG